MLNLWRDQVDLVKPGDLIKVENAFAKEFRDRVELNVGRSGRIVVLKHGEGQNPEERRT
jgi:ssDNA-binding replication factor A large subunit